MRYDDFVSLVDTLATDFSLEIGPPADRPSAKLYELWVRQAGGTVRGLKKRKKKVQKGESEVSPVSAEDEGQEAVEVVQLKYLQRSNAEQMEKLFGLLRHEPLAIQHYLCKLIFPVFTRREPGHTYAHTNTHQPCSDLSLF